MDTGIYELAVDVKNPAADNRARHDWRLLPVWKKGTRFVCREHPVARSREILPVGEYVSKGMSVARGDATLLVSLVRVEARSAQEVIESSPDAYSLAAVLEKLFETGVVSADQIRTALKQIGGE